MARAKAQAVPRESSLPPTLLEKYKEFPGIKAVARRIVEGDQAPSVDIRLKGDPSYQHDPTGRKRMWKVRWINTKWPGRYAQVTKVLGYVPVRVSELLDADDLPELHRKAEDGADPFVRKGDKGEEVLVKLPMELYTATKQAQQDRRNRRSRSAKVMKEEMANNAARELGDEAADTIHDEFNLTLSRKRSTLGDELSGSELLDEA